MKTGYTEREGRVGGFESVDKLLIDNVNLVLPDIRQTVHLIQPQTRHISNTHTHMHAASSLSIWSSHRPGTYLRHMHTHRQLGRCSLYLLTTQSFIMVALWNRADHYIFMLWLFLLSFFFFSSPNLSRRRLDVCNTSTHGVALVRI